MYKTNPIKLREILNDCTESDWEEIVQHASSVVDDEKLNASSKPLISPTTVPHQGSTRMQNDCNHASSSNFAPQSPAKSTCSTVNAQGKHSDFCF
ncbi:hypothetical protein QYF36_001670 [Acer negundo]|nr:hypothetical protein QYF36_001670 [Acer negundo]